MLLNVCLCFNSDVGYRKNVTNLNTCEYDPTSGVDPSGMPENCPEGSFYHRTKGQVEILWSVDSIAGLLSYAPLSISYIQGLSVNIMKFKFFFSD